MVESIATTTVGTSVTGSISPILPEIVAAKAALSAINAVLDAFDF
jgi:hypothetical protein